jgi:hypothetical protein
MLVLANSRNSRSPFVEFGSGVPMAESTSQTEKEE